MAKCKLCKTDIPDGTEYCVNCQEKRKAIANESYLDSLLNSVKNPVPASETIYKKKNTDKNSNPEPALSREEESDGQAATQDYDDYKVDLNDIDDFDQFFKDEDFEKVSIDDEELFGEKLSDLFDDADTVSRNQEPEKSSRINNDTAKGMPSSDLVTESEEPASGNGQASGADNRQLSYSSQSMAGGSQPLKEENQPLKKENQPLREKNQPLKEENQSSKEESQLRSGNGQPRFGDNQRFSLDNQADGSNDINTEGNEKSVPLDNLADNFTPEEISEAQDGDEDSGMDPDLDELLNSLDSIQNNSPVPPAPAPELKEPAEKSNSAAPEPNKSVSGGEEEFEPVGAEDDDFLSLLNQLSADDPVGADVKAINDLLNGKPPEEKKSTAPSDVGEVFSDALKVVSSLNDPSINEDELLGKIPDVKKEKDRKKKKQKKVSKPADDDEQQLNAVKANPKKGLFKSLFGNVKDEKTAKKAHAEKLKAEAAVTKEKIKKVKKDKKGAPAEASEAEENLSGTRGKSRPGDENEQPDLKESKKENKKDKKEKKKKTKEVIQVIDEIEEDEGRINRLGASIVFIFFGLLVVLLLVGTNMVSYTLSIQHATDYFGKHKYNQAYKEVYGVDIQDKDLVIYEKIMTVMFVNKQLNSYNNYYSLGKYPEALDSLLKGLKRYDKYIELATMLGIKTDLDYVRTQILAELKNVFNLSEKEALKIISNDNMKEYSLEVYNAVLEKMNN